MQGTASRRYAECYVIALKRKVGFNQLSEICGVWLTFKVRTKQGVRFERRFDDLRPAGEETVRAGPAIQDVEDDVDGQGRVRSAGLVHGLVRRQEHPVGRIRVLHLRE
jgi:hypothetical protein